MTSLYVFGALSLVVALSEWLVRRTALKHIGSALLVIILTAVVANVGLMPTGSTPENPVPAYDFVFGIVAPLSVFWLLLRVNLREVLKAGPQLLGVFLLGSFATFAGVVIGMLVVGGSAAFGESYPALGGMFVGTYTGGSVNFNAVALHYGVMSNGVLFGGAVVVDNIVTTFWIAITLIVPRLVYRRRDRSASEITASDSGPTEALHEAGQVREAILGIEEDTESVHPIDIAITLASGLLALAVSEWIESVAAAAGAVAPSILVLTTIALVIAHTPVAQYIRGARTLGMFAVYIFLAVIGAYCDIGAMIDLGSLGWSLLAFTGIAVLVHGSIVYGFAGLFRIDPVLTSVASQANVGGATSALALARSLGRDDLVLPAVLLGSLGLAIGTYLGFLASGVVLPALGL